MRITLMSNEFPPDTYGGAGVHIDYLSRELARLDQASHSIRVLCFSQDPKPREANIHPLGIPLKGDAFPNTEAVRGKILTILQNNLEFVAAMEEADVVHCHTWYTHFAGCLVRDLFQIPLVLTTHSLEPNRPWKEEQLGTGYQVSTWLEQSAYQKADGIIAVSEAMKRDVQHCYQVPEDRIGIIPNGIDTEEYDSQPDPEALRTHHIDPDRPYILFVGRITPQKGIFHLLEAAPKLRQGTQIVLCASSADTPGMREDLLQRVENINRTTDKQIIWIERHLAQSEIIPLYSGAAVFVCPSVYEPFGIINLEAMACGTPVVASQTGGIPDIVLHGKTGFLVPYATVSKRDPQPRDPETFATDLARNVNTILDDPDMGRDMGRQGRQRVRKTFSWSAVARRTLDFYHSLLESPPGSEGKQAGSQE
ncbi:MAG: glycogen synthase [Desulfohalobiaceae bacterium]|nr:glycogen synthase [Desulfohalobiaceae bacterium]